VSSKRSKAKRKERVKKTHSAVQIGEARERERKKKEKKKRNEKIKKLEIVFLTLGTHRAHPLGYILYNLYGTI
jgi:hypothetical protein